MYVRTGDEDYRRMTKFWGKLFLINFAIGVVTGITLEFQFGTNWSRYSAYVGDIFGSLLAIEATVAFFLESTFIAVWFFGWKKLSPKAHAATIWLVAIASNLSAFWILVANAWMQHPVGLRDPQRPRRADRLLRGDHAELRDPGVRPHPRRRLHPGRASSCSGISAWHLLRKQRGGLLRQVVPPGRDLDPGLRRCSRSPRAT